jgi:filamentous hemagglutinin family protein
MSFSLSRAIVIAALAAAPISAIALPTFSSVVSGSASFATAGNTLTIQTSGDTTITWNSFSINPGETVYFSQSASQYHVINTVLGMDAAQILGRLSSNGGISLNDNAGIFVGASGMLSAPSLSLDSGQGPLIIENHTSLASVDINLSGNPVSVGGPPGPSDPIILVGGGGIISSVPEPETYAMMLAGLGLLGVVARRRKQKVAA